MSPVLSTALLGGALAIDHRSSVRLLVSQPICGGLLAGLVLGEPRGGFLAGALLQMLFLGWTNVRGVRAPDLPLGGVTAAAVSILARRMAGYEPAAVGLALFLSLAAALGVSAAGRGVYRLWENRSYFLTDMAIRCIDRDRLGCASALHLATLAVHFAVGFAIVAAAVAVVPPLVAGIAERVSGSWSDSLGDLRTLIPFIGVGSLLSLNLRRIRLVFFLAGFCVVYLVAFFGG